LGKYFFCLISCINSKTVTSALLPAGNRISSPHLLGSQCARALFKMKFRECVSNRQHQKNKQMRKQMRSSKILIALAGVAAMARTPAYAYEAGAAGWAQKPGITLGGASAGVPPPGLYMIDQAFTYQSNLAGPGNSVINPHGTTTGVPAAVGVTAFVWVPGWTFLGATYDAAWAIPVGMFAVGSPANVEASGMINTFIAPIELSWKLGDSGFQVKTGLGMYVPDGTVTGVNGLGNVGNPWWSFMPEFVVSYLKDGRNLTANVFEEINTKSTVTQYRSGDILHAEFTATKTIGKWTVGPVAYYAGQVSDDKSSAFYGGAINVNRYNIWAVGGSLGYNFGPAQLTVWALDEVSANASGGTPQLPPGPLITKGFSAFAQLSYRLWAPDEPVAAPKSPIYRK
jgi:hypothetical protein